MQKNTVFILSGPAGTGKTTLWNSIENETTQIEKVITTTSRPIREGEKDGIHYHFLSRSEFENQIQSGNLIEYAVVHTNYYGSTSSELERITDNHRSPIYIIEPQGMMHLKPILENKGYKVVTIFLLPPSLSELRKRLHGRGTETPEQFDIRLATALIELEQQDSYDIKIMNDRIKMAKKELLYVLQRNI